MRVKYYLSQKRSVLSWSIHDVGLNILLYVDILISSGNLLPHLLLH